MTMSLSHVVGLIFVLVTLAGSVHLLVYYALTGAPPVPSGRADRARLCALLKESQLIETANIYELGAAWGGLALALHRAFPLAEIYAIERSPIAYLWMRLRFAKNAKIHVLRQNFHQMDLRQADALTCFLMIKPMQKLAITLDDQIRQGTVVVSLAFRFRDRRPSLTADSPDAPGGIALYRWPAMKKQNNDQTRSS